MQLVIKILSTAEVTGGPLTEKLPFCYNEKKVRWIAASDAINVGDEAVIGVHAECGESKEMMNLLLIHGSEVFANLVFHLSERQMFTVRFSKRYMVTATIEQK
jgi:hypothetical protein